ncbi:hypothetical protein DBV05_g11648 [Lasiodiplodia theobromae]|uniref:Uncharacterized protein n=1 Tax=Lasiodiplodia theobromae TaxID=45133 RepID=A0A5N5CWH5_9PEZI|nr:hypothetical protein DBV05_g11648 [Lasiodiplodia theobromae]
MTESLANLFTRLSGLLPQSVSDQASKMFVKRLLKHFFDRLEELLVQMQSRFCRHFFCRYVARAVEQEEFFAGFFDTTRCC